MVLSKLAEEMSNTIVATIKGADDVLSALRGAVKNQVTGTLKDVGDIASSSLEGVADVVHGDGADEVGFTNAVRICGFHVSPP